MSKVTVIIPYRKDRGWLQQAIDSVPLWCQLIVEQGDDNKSVVFNRALKKATGDVIKVLDEDDILVTENLTKLVDKLCQGYDFVHANAIVIDENGNEKGRFVPKIKEPGFSDIYRFNHIYNPTVIYRRDVFERLGGYDESLIKSQDWEYHLRCLSGGMKIGYIDSYVTYYRRHKEQVTKKLYSKNCPAREQIKNKYAGGRLAT